MKFLSQEEYKKYHENLRKQGYFVETTPVLLREIPWTKEKIYFKECPEIVSFLKGLNG